MNNDNIDDCLANLCQLIQDKLKWTATPRSLGARIAHARHERKLTQAQLVNRLREKRFGEFKNVPGAYYLTRAYLSNLENGRYGCSLDLLADIAKELKVTRAYLLGENHEWFNLTGEEKRLIVALRLLKNNRDMIY